MQKTFLVIHQQDDVFFALVGVFTNKTIGRRRPCWCFHQQDDVFFSDGTPVGTQKGCYYYLFDFKTTYIYAL